MKKMYVMVRGDLTPAQQAVQGGHGLAQILLHGDADGWDNGTLVYLKVKSEACLTNLAARLAFEGLRYEMWMEPDMENELTAIAAYLDEEVMTQAHCI